MRPVACLLLVSLLLLASACDRPSPVQQVLELIEEVERLVEAGETRSVAGKVSDDYADAEGRDKQIVLTLLNLATRERDAHLWKNVDRLEAIADDHVEATVLIAVASEPILGPTSLRDIDADFLRFDAVVRLEGDGVWRVTSASWRSARLEDFF